MPKPIKLAADYSNEHGGINAYDALDERGRGNRKEAFLTAGKAVLRRVAHALIDQGWSSKINANRGGIAVSGEVYMTLVNPSLTDKKLFVEITTTGIRGGEYGRVTDGACIIVQIRHGNQIGNNIWLSADLDSDQLTAKLRRIIEGL